MPYEAKDCIEYNLIPTISRPCVIRELGKVRDEIKCNPEMWSNLIKRGDNIKPGSINIKIDSGMSRNGCQPSEFDDLLRICDEAKVNILNK